MEYRLPQTLSKLLNFHPAYCRKITYKELAKNIGVSPPCVSMYVSGERMPTIPVLLKMADYLQVSMDYLITGTEPENKSADDITLKELQSLQRQASMILNKTEKIIAEREETK